MVTLKYPNKFLIDVSSYLRAEITVETEGKEPRTTNGTDGARQPRSHIHPPFKGVGFWMRWCHRQAAELTALSTMEWASRSPGRWRRRWVSSVRSASRRAGRARRG